MDNVYLWTRPNFTAELKWRICHLPTSTSMYAKSEGGMITETSAASTPGVIENGSWETSNTGSANLSRGINWTSIDWSRSYIVCREGTGTKADFLKHRRMLSRL